METPARFHRELIDYAADRYREMFVALFLDQGVNGEIPGLEPMSDEQLLSMFHNWPQEVFARIAARDPKGALKLMREYARLEGKIPQVSIPPLPIEPVISRPPGLLPGIPPYPPSQLPVPPHYPGVPLPLGVA